MFPASIKTGFSTVSSSDIGLSEETNRRIQAILIMFMGKSVELASSYAVAAGRNTVTAMDVLYALQYFAHELEHLPDIEEECEKYYNDYAEIEDEDIDDEDIEDEDIEDEDIDDEDIEDEDIEDDEDIEEVADDDEPFTRCESNDELIMKMNRYHDDWEAWCPTDSVQMGIKNAINKTMSSIV